MSDRKAFFEHLRMKDLFWNAFRSVSFSLMPYLNRYMKELLEELEVTREMIVIRAVALCMGNYFYLVEKKVHVSI